MDRMIVLSQALEAKILFFKTHRTFRKFGSEPAVPLRSVNIAGGNYNASTVCLYGQSRYQLIERKKNTRQFFE